MIFWSKIEGNIGHFWRENSNISSSLMMRLFQSIFQTFLSLSKKEANVLNSLIRNTNIKEKNVHEMHFKKRKKKVLHFDGGKGEVNFFVVFSGCPSKFWIIRIYIFCCMSSMILNILNFPAKNGQK